MPKFENTWNWTNVISMSVMIVGGLGAFFTVQGKTQHLELTVVKLEKKIDDVQTTTQTEQRISEQRIISLLSTMQADIREIRAAQLRKGKE